MGRDLKVVTDSYIECALWADMEEDADDSGWTGLSPEFRDKAREECEDFLQLLDRENVDTSEWTDSQMGHDFWLTRQRHGTGFWDRGYTSGDVITKWANSYSSQSLYVGDDGLIYSA